MKVIQKITSVFLAVLFLLSSLGFTVGKMVCLKSGKTKVSLSSVEDCCAKAKKQNANCCDEEQENTSSDFVVKKSDCCDISNTTLQLNDFNPSHKKELTAVEHTLFISESSFYFNTSVTENKSILSFADLPPPLHGRTLLNFISVLTI